MSDDFYGLHFDFEINITPGYGVQADVQLTIDTTNAEDIDASIDAFVSNFDEDWEVIAECILFIYTEKSFC